MDSKLAFLDVLSCLLEYIDAKSKSKLRLVGKHLREAIDFNVRGLVGRLDQSYREVNMARFILKLPNLETIKAVKLYRKCSLISVFKAAQHASRLSRLELTFTPYVGLHSDDEEYVADAFSTMRQCNWPSLKTVIISHMSKQLPTQSLKGLLGLPNLVQLELPFSDFSDNPEGAIRTVLHLTLLQNLNMSTCALNGKAISMIRLGDWPQLKQLELGNNDFSDDPVGALKGLLQLSSLQDKLNLKGCVLTGKAISQIRPGHWPHLKELVLVEDEAFDQHMHTDFSDDPCEAMKGLLQLTALQQLDISICGLSGNAIGQIRPGDWPNIEELALSYNDLENDTVGAIKGLVHLTNLEMLYAVDCGLTGEAVSHIKPGDWPHLSKLVLSSNHFTDSPAGAMKALLHLAALEELNVLFCELSGWAIHEIKRGQWPHLKTLELQRNSLNDNPAAAIAGLLRLTALEELDLHNCRLSGRAMRIIKSGHWPELHTLHLSGNSFGDDVEGTLEGLLHLRVAGTRCVFDPLVENGDFEEEFGDDE